MKTTHHRIKEIDPALTSNLEDVTEFLKNNGFKETERPDGSMDIYIGCYTNGRCTVGITVDNYDVYFSLEEWPSQGVMPSKDHNFYWLVGMLTWYDLIDKD